MAHQTTTTTPRLLERVERLQRRYADLQAQADDAREARDAALREAVDGGCTYREVARAAGVSSTLVYKVMASGDG